MTWRADSDDPGTPCGNDAAGRGARWPSSGEPGRRTSGHGDHWCERQELWIFPGTIGTLPKIFLAMGSRFYSKIPVKLPALSIPLRFAKSTALRPCTSVKEARADFPRTANGRFPFFRENKEQVKLLPIGPGQPRRSARPVWRNSKRLLHFLADGKHITLNANEPGHGVRSYLVDMEGGKPVPITPEGITGGLISPDRQIYSSSRRCRSTRSLSYRAEERPVPSQISSQVLFLSNGRRTTSSFYRVPSGPDSHEGVQGQSSYRQEDPSCRNCSLRPPQAWLT